MTQQETKQKGSQWFAIRTKPNKEQLARINYQQQDYEVYLPLFRTIVRHARRTKEVLKPFFPGYLFLFLAPEERDWIAISSTRGALGPVCFGDQYIPVPDWVIDGLKHQEESPGILSPAKALANQFAAGAPVEVVLGDGVVTEGTIFSFDGGKNVIVLLDLLQRRVKATVPLAWVSDRK